MANRILNSEQEKEIVKLYLSDITQKEILKIFNIKKSVFLRTLHRQGIKPERMRCVDRKQLYNFDRKYFKNIDSQNKAYWLGWLASDGSVRKGTVTLRITDEEIIKNLQQCLNGNIPTKYHPPKTENHSETFRITINSLEMVKDLGKMGVVPNKTKRTYIPILDKELQPHFIRGYFEGDGCLYISKNNLKVIFQITSSSLKVLEQIQNILKENNIIKQNNDYIKKIPKNCWNLKIENKPECMKALDFIYKDAILKLNRKFLKYMHFKEIGIRKVRSDSGTGISGISSLILKNGETRWLAHITYKKNRMRLGTFKDKVSAIQARNAKIKELGLPDYMLNKIEE